MAIFGSILAYQKQHDYIPNNFAEFAEINLGCTHKTNVEEIDTDRTWRRMFYNGELRMVEFIEYVFPIDCCSRNYGHVQLSYQADIDILFIRKPRKV